MSENEDSKMSEESDAETSRSHKKEDIFGKHEDQYYGNNDDDDSATDYTDEDDDSDKHYSRKRANLILGKYLLMELINTYEALSMQLYINKGKDNPDIDTEWA